MGIHERWDRAKAFTLPITTRIHLHPKKDKWAKFRNEPSPAFERAKKAIDEDVVRLRARFLER
jgi:hypothetical protein